MELNQTFIEEFAKDHNQTIAALRQILKSRVDFPLSITGGKGTAWGWIDIRPAPRLLNEYGQTTPEHAAKLREIFGETANSGISVPASTAHRLHYLKLAAGLGAGEQPAAYWD